MMRSSVQFAPGISKNTDRCLSATPNSFKSGLPSKSGCLIGSEIVHETFVWAYRHLDEFQSGTSFQAWLRAIAWNLIRAELQRFAREHKHRKDYFKHRLWLDRIAAGEECADGRE